MASNKKSNMDVFGAFGIEASAEVDANDIELSLIDPNPDQPRRYFDETALEELVKSIRDQGVLQPILLTPRENRYLIVAGQRRWEAAKRANLPKIPARVLEMSDADIPLAALSENLIREDLSDIEIIRGLAKLKDLENVSGRALADRIGKPKSWVADRLMLSRRSDLLELIEAGELSVTAAIRSTREAQKPVDSRSVQLSDTLVHWDENEREYPLREKEVKESGILDDWEAEDAETRKDPTLSVRQLDTNDSISQDKVENDRVRDEAIKATFTDEARLKRLIADWTNRAAFDADIANRLATTARWAAIQFSELADIIEQGQKAGNKDNG